MTDYIKKEDAIRSIADHDEFKGERWIKEAWADYLIEDAKPADVAPVRHGRWEERDDLDFDTLYRCSVCGEEFYLIYGTPRENQYYFCPNCGAKMDGGDTDA